MDPGLCQIQVAASALVAVLVKNPDIKARQVRVLILLNLPLTRSPPVRGVFSAG